MLNNSRRTFTMPGSIRVKPDDERLNLSDGFECSWGSVPQRGGVGRTLGKILGAIMRMAGSATPSTAICFYGWIWSVQRNCQVAVALIATETMKSEISGTDMFSGPLPVSRRNIQGSRIMA